MKAFPGLRSIEELEVSASQKILMLANHRRRQMLFPDLLEDTFLSDCLGDLLQENKDVIRSKASRFNWYLNQNLAVLLGFFWAREIYKPRTAYALIVEDSNNYEAVIKNLENHIFNSNSFTDRSMSFLCCKVMQYEGSIIVFYVLHAFPVTLGQIRKHSLT